jgi:hypothetical protein
VPSSEGHVSVALTNHTAPADGVLVEKPADKWPDVFSKVPLLLDYPYLLPCALAASITLTGAFLDPLMFRTISSLFRRVFLVAVSGARWRTAVRFNSPTTGKAWRSPPDHS